MNSPGGRLQVKPSRSYRVVWGCFVLGQLAVQLLCMQRVSAASSCVLALLQCALLVASYRVPQQDEIVCWLEGRWWLWHEGHWRDASLGPVVVLLPCLTGFTLLVDRPRHFLLFADGASHNDLHRLRVQLALHRSGQR